jgi:Ca2+-transporting ATPase
MLGFGLLMGALAVAIYLLPAALGPAAATPAGARTLAFSFLAFAPLVHVFNCRGSRTSLLSLRWKSNVFLWLAVLASAALQLVVLLAPDLHGVFHATPLGPRDALVLAAASLVALPVWEIGKLILRAAERRRPAALD